MLVIKVVSLAIGRKGEIMQILIDTLLEVMRLRAEGNLTEAQQLFQQYEERATSLGLPLPLPAIRHLLLDANLVNMQETWSSCVPVLEQSLETAKSDGEPLGMLEALVNLVQVHIYLNQPHKAATYLEQLQEQLDSVVKKRYLKETVFYEWEPLIIQAKKKQADNLSYQLKMMR